MARATVPPFKIMISDLKSIPDAKAREMLASTEFQYVQQSIQMVAVELYNHMKAVPEWNDKNTEDCQMTLLLTLIHRLDMDQPEDAETSVRANAKMMPNADPMGIFDSETSATDAKMARTPVKLAPLSESELLWLMCVATIRKLYNGLKTGLASGTLDASKALHEHGRDATKKNGTVTVPVMVDILTKLWDDLVDEAVVENLDFAIRLAEFNDMLSARFLAPGQTFGKLDEDEIAAFNEKWHEYFVVTGLRWELFQQTIGLVEVNHLSDIHITALVEAKLCELIDNEDEHSLKRSDVPTPDGFECECDVCHCKPFCQVEPQYCFCHIDPHPKQLSQQRQLECLIRDWDTGASPSVPRSSPIVENFPADHVIHCMTAQSPVAGATATAAVINGTTAVFASSGYEVPADIMTPPASPSLPARKIATVPAQQKVIEGAIQHIVQNFSHREGQTAETEYVDYMRTTLRPMTVQPKTYVHPAETRKTPKVKRSATPSELAAEWEKFCEESKFASAEKEAEPASNNNETNANNANGVSSEQQGEANEYTVPATPPSSPSGVNDRVLQGPPVPPKDEKWLKLKGKKVRFAKETEFNGSTPARPPTPFYAPEPPVSPTRRRVNSFIKGVNALFFRF